MIHLVCSLTGFLFPLHTPDITIKRIQSGDQSRECSKQSTPTTQNQTKPKIPCYWEGIPFITRNLLQYRSQVTRVKLHGVDLRVDQYLGPGRNLDRTLLLVSPSRTLDSGHRKDTAPSPTWHTNPQKKERVNNPAFTVIRNSYPRIPRVWKVGLRRGGLTHT